MTGRKLLRPLAGAALVGVVLWRVGVGPLIDGMRAAVGWPLIAALALGAATTLGGAWRWRLVARGLGVEVPLRTATAACYRAQFLNATLPTGVLGDVDRGVRSGRQSGDLGRGLRAVAWERLAGQLVQIALTVAVLCIVPSPFRSWMPSALGVVVAVALLIAVLGLRRPQHGSSRWHRMRATVSGDLRDGLLRRAIWPGVLAGSVVVVVAQVAMFVLAALVAGAAVVPGPRVFPVPVSALLPIALLMLLAMAVPVNVGGWGPREGVAAWAFGAAGLGASLGLAAAASYGVLALVATAPGLGVLGLSRVRRPTATSAPQRVPEGAPIPSVALVPAAAG